MKKISTVQSVEAALAYLIDVRSVSKLASPVPVIGLTVKLPKMPIGHLPPLDTSSITPNPK